MRTDFQLGRSAAMRAGFWDAAQNTDDNLMTFGDTWPEDWRDAYEKGFLVGLPHQHDIPEDVKPLEAEEPENVLYGASPFRVELVEAGETWAALLPAEHADDDVAVGVRRWLHVQTNSGKHWTNKYVCLAERSNRDSLWVPVKHGGDKLAATKEKNNE